MPATMPHPSSPWVLSQHRHLLATKVLERRYDSFFWPFSVLPGSVWIASQDQFVVVI
jgi:hypothetical protein